MQHIQIGGRLGYSIRGTLQSQAKGFLEFQHESRMTKMRAILDQENWAEIDVPDEFQAIVTSFFCSEKLLLQVRLLQVMVLASGYCSTRKFFRFKEKLTQLRECNVDPESNSAHTVESNSRERGKASPRMLYFNEIGYHMMVNCGLILVKMLSEYIDMNNSLSGLSSEVVHRVVEILKFFQHKDLSTCPWCWSYAGIEMVSISASSTEVSHIQKILEMDENQVSGLKSITSKHLALASQVISFTYAIIPVLPNFLISDYLAYSFVLLKKSRGFYSLKYLKHAKGLLMLEIDRVAQEVGLLQRVLSRTLHEVDVQTIFRAVEANLDTSFRFPFLTATIKCLEVCVTCRQVVQIFHTQISEALSRVDISTPQVKNRMHRDIQHILGCIRSLPSDELSKSNPPNWGKLDEFVAQNFGAEAS
nr:vacuolar protein sorting-associated protein 54, chloroplastic [Ipomoea batatas]